MLDYKKKSLTEHAPSHLKWLSLYDLQGAYAPQGPVYGTIALLPYLCLERAFALPSYRSEASSSCLSQTNFELFYV